MINLHKIMLFSFFSIITTFLVTKVFCFSYPLLPEDIEQAFQAGDTKTLEKIIENGNNFNINQRYENGKNILHLASSSGYLGIVQYLINNYNTLVDEKDVNE